MEEDKKNNKRNTTLTNMLSVTCGFIMLHLDISLLQNFNFD